MANTTKQVKMEGKDLRIGNIISFKGEPVEVIKIYGSGLVQVFSETFQFWDADIQDGEAEPIPLSEGWLNKFGFKKDHHGYYFEDINSLSFSIDKDGKFLPCYNDRVINQHLRIFHLHQLQNLYYVLTGQDITINQAQ